MKAIKATIIAATGVAALAFAAPDASAQRFGGSHIGGFGGGFGEARIGGFGGYGRFGGYRGGFGFGNGFWPGLALGALTGVVAGGWGYGPNCGDYYGYGDPSCGYGYGYGYPYYGGYGYPAAYGYGYGYGYPYASYGYGAPFTGGGFFAEYRGRVSHTRPGGFNHPVAHPGGARVVRAGVSSGVRR